jgi:phage gp36-like protein
MSVAMDCAQSTAPQTRRIDAALAAASAAIIAFRLTVPGWSLFAVTVAFCCENVVP